MPELSSPLSLDERAGARLVGMERTREQLARLESQFRLELAAWSGEDFAFGHREFACDEFALAFAESPGTAGRTIELAQRYAAFPAVVAQVGLPVAEGGWSIRHADAVLDVICGVALSSEQQSEAVQLVLSSQARTPHEIRKAALAAVMALDPAAAARRYDKDTRERRVGADSHADGAAATFWATGTVTQVASVMASLDALAGPKQPGEDRTLSQRRFDALMDLVCGRVQPGQWQALIVVTLATLEGGVEPAEVPGFGLISAAEAQDVLAHAELRRAVVDEHGTLVSLGAHTCKPDGHPAPNADPARQVSLETEPDPLDSSCEHPPTDQDQTWHETLLGDRDENRDEDVDMDLDQDLDQQVAACTSELEAELRALLCCRPLVGAVANVSSPGMGLLGVDVEAGSWSHRRGGGGGGGGGGRELGPPDPPPDSPPDPFADPPPDPPSESDLLWEDRTLDRAALAAHQPRSVFEPEPDPPDGQLLGPASRRSSWTPGGLHRARLRMLTAPVDRRTLESSAYALPPRLARHIKIRDITCTFPGCLRLARDCENDHLIPWPQGPSSEGNISSECKHHHLAKHHYLTAHRLSSGALRWATPLGRTYDRHPRPLLRGW